MSINTTIPVDRQTQCSYTASRLVRPFITSTYLPNNHNTEKGGKEMEKKVLFSLPLFVLLAWVLFAGFALAKNAPPQSRLIDPIVSTDWLAANQGTGNLVILDVRSAKDYGSGHILSSINVPFAVPVSAWIVMRDELLLEVPEQAALFHTIGSCGIKPDSRVVIVSATANPPNPPYPLADATRVADTLIYAGVKNVAILDGGYPKWAKEGKPTTTDVPNMNPATYKSKINRAMFVSKEYVQKHKGKAAIVDARDADVYIGVAMEPFANKPGHIPGAKSLPAPWIWNPDGTYRDVKMLGLAASGIISKNKAKQIIVYCGVGGYASSWWFVLTQVLGYQNVKFYDGSAQEWVRYYDMVPYKWE
jgi:thiosulfate/3-mercaptopyruvate sulfurtransferase